MQRLVRSASRKAVAHGKFAGNNAALVADRSNLYGGGEVEITVEAGNLVLGQLESTTGFVLTAKRFDFGWRQCQHTE